MATVKSTQVTNMDAVPRSKLKPNELEGRVRVAYFDYASPSSSPPGVNDILQLCKLPNGARILKGRLFHDGIGGASGTADIGYSGATTRYSSGGSVANSAGQLDFADTYAENGGDALSAAQTIILTVKTAAFTASKNLKGYILYVID